MLSRVTMDGVLRETSKRRTGEVGRAARPGIVGCGPTAVSADEPHDRRATGPPTLRRPMDLERRDKSDAVVGGRGHRRRRHRRCVGRLFSCTQGRIGRPLREGSHRRRAVGAQLGLGAPAGPLSRRAAAHDPKPGRLEGICRRSWARTSASGRVARSTSRRLPPSSRSLRNGCRSHGRMGSTPAC